MTSTGSALGRRLAAVADVLLGPGEHSNPSSTLDALISSVHADLAADRMWLLYAAVAAALPDEAELRRSLRFFELHPVARATQWLLAQTLRVARTVGSTGVELQIVVGATVVDVDISSRSDIHTGIQRVVRSTLPRWQRTHDVTPVAWTAGRAMLRTLSSEEEARASGRSLPEASADGDADQDPAQLLVLPWRSTVVLAEVPTRDVCARLAALAQHSGNRVVAIGYDCIPVVSADLVPAAEPNRFVRYLSVLKHVDEVVGISAATAREFAGFTAMLPAQGLRGPQVTECVLPVDEVADVIDVRAPAAEATGAPTIICVGRLEPRKNQMAVLDAAERLWREGIDFRLQLIGGGSRDRSIVRAVHRLRRAGRPVTLTGATDDVQLSEAYAEARFSVFVSLHEGYGLPVAESLAHGTPVLTSNYGSQAEIGEAGGGVLVDPRDDDAIVAAMRRLLLDDALHTELGADIARRPSRTWDDYADELWRIITADAVR